MIKRKLYKCIILTLVSTLTVLNINVVKPSSIEEILFKNISIEEGLSQATVETIIQDKKGYMWIGTNDGLSRYNGYEFKIYRKEKGVENSIANNYVVDLKEDDKGNIWVGTINGLSKISEDGITISNYTDRPKEGNLSNYNIGDILVTRDNRVLVATSKGIDIYDEEWDTFLPFIKEPYKLRGEVVYSIDEDEEGNIWVGTDEGIDKITPDGKIVNDFLFETGNANLEKERVFKVYAGNKKEIWIGTFSNGITKIDLEKKKIENYNMNLQGNYKLPSNYIKNFMEDSFGNLWASSEEGLLQYDREKNAFRVHNHRIYDKNSLIDDDTFVAFQDKGGLIWVGTYSGISVFDPNNRIKRYSKDPFSENTLSDNMVQGIYEDKEGLLWVGTNSKGLNIMDRKNNKVYRVNMNNGLSSNSVNSITGKGNTVYIGTHNGVNIINKEDKTIKYINLESGLVNEIVKNLHISSTGKLWIGTVGGFNIYNPEDGSLYDITPFLQDADIKDVYSGAIFEDKEGVFWLGTFLNGGLIKLDKENKTITNFTHDKEDPKSISDNTVRSIVEDSKNNLWIGTRLGLNKLNKETLEFTSYTTAEGLPNNHIYGVLLDENEDIWMSTNSGLSNYKVDDNTFVNLDISDGLQSNEFNGQAYHRGASGEMFFGGINGLNSFMPSDLNDYDYISSLEFDEFKINGNEILGLNKKDLKSSENNVNIQLFIPDYRNTKGNTYFYRINSSSENDWIPLEGNEVNFTNLSSGNYNIDFIGRTSNGSYTKEQSISFKIKPHFLVSGRAFICYFLLLVLIYINQKNKNKRLDCLVEHRTIELNNEMSKNSQLYDRIIELERYKNNYFINLSHELRTPLNVLSSTQQLITTLNNSEEGIDEEKLNYYMDIVRRNIKRLLKIINDIIDTSKIEGGKYELDVKPGDIVRIVEDATLSLKSFGEAKGVELIIDPLIEEKIILCDECEIERCIVNIVSNGIKFSNEGSKIFVTLEETDDGYIKIEIVDEGIGIPDEFHEVIFDRFSQVVDQKAEVKGGSGLGLTITKKIIDLHHGEISLESKVDVGTKFTILLPIN